MSTTTTETPSYVLYPTMVPRPGPGDWPEDFEHDNGNYLCRCCHCHATFTGHKRRVVCRACAKRGEAENDRRAALLNGAGLSGDDWVLMTPTELAAERAAYADLLLELTVERNLRRDVTKALDRLLDCISETRGPDAYHAVLDGREVAAKSAQLDAEIAARAAAKEAGRS